MKQKFRIKIAIIYFVIVGVIIGSYFIAFKAIYMSHELKVMGEESVNTLQTMKTVTLAIIETANNYSKILLADEDIQEVLKSGDIYSNVPGQFKVAKKIYGILQFANEINGVYLIDQKDQIYSVGAREDLVGKLTNKEQMGWYQSVIEKNGNYILSLDSPDIVRKPLSNQVSLIRVYKDLKNFRNRGVLFVNINRTAFRNTYKEILKEDREQIIFLDEQNRIICQDGLTILQAEEREMFLNKLGSAKEGTLKEVFKDGDKKYLVTGVVIPTEGWKIIRLQPTDMRQESFEVLSANILLMLLSAFFILMGTILVANLITVPISHLLISMKSAERGEFTKVKYKPFFDEFRYLFEGYNQLLDKISLLLEQTIEKQKKIRKVELNEMQGLMKPHFLYNTLDSIQALAMLGELGKVCETVEALGDFYRRSVSKGRELLSIEEEVAIVVDYIKIMKVRFENLFEETIEVEPCCKNYLIPKLTLQPLVENAIHHGLREGTEKGELYIGIRREKEWIHLCIADNGFGIPVDLLSELKSDPGCYKGKSFGLRGTIERMKIIYGDKFKYEITSKANELTDISFYVHIEALEG